MLLAVAAAFAVLLALGLFRGFASVKWLALSFAVVVAVISIPLLWTALDPADRCLDSGGRWNTAAEVCER